MRVLVSDFTPSAFGVRTELNGDLFAAGDEVSSTRALDAFLRRPVRRRRGARHCAAGDAKRFARRIPSQHRSCSQHGSWPSGRPIARADDARRTRRASAGTRFASRGPRGTGRVRNVERRRRGARRPRQVRRIGGERRLHRRRPARRVEEHAMGVRQGEPAAVRVPRRRRPRRARRRHGRAVAIERLETKAARVEARHGVSHGVHRGVAPGRRVRGRSTDAPLTARSLRPIRAATGSRRAIATPRPAAQRRAPHVGGGKGRLVWRDGNDDALELVPEKREYEIGEPRAISSRIRIRARRRS